jgi:hypothetical protein
MLCADRAGSPARAAALERMALRELSALERYERRALSRRRRAIRALAGANLTTLIDTF